MRDRLGAALSAVRTEEDASVTTEEDERHDGDDAPPSRPASALSNLSALLPSAAAIITEEQRRRIETNKAVALSRRNHQPASAPAQSPPTFSVTLGSHPETPGSRPDRPSGARPSPAGGSQLPAPDPAGPLALRARPQMPSGARPSPAGGSQLPKQRLFPMFRSAPPTPAGSRPDTPSGARPSTTAGGSQQLGTAPRVLFPGSRGDDIDAAAMQFQVDTSRAAAAAVAEPLAPTQPTVASEQPMELCQPEPLPPPTAATSTTADAGEGEGEGEGAGESTGEEAGAEAVAKVRTLEASMPSCSWYKLSPWTGAWYKLPEGLDEGKRVSIISLTEEDGVCVAEIKVEGATSRQPTSTRQRPAC